MNYLFRVDASSEIGIGHFMRCLTLALEIKKDGAYLRFVTRHLPKYLAELLKENAIEHVQLNARSLGIHGTLKHASWLGVSQDDDAKDTVMSLAGGHWDWLIVDHYALDQQWERQLNKFIKNIMVIDDLADRQHSCNILLDQNYFIGIENRYQDKLLKHCKLLLGPTYALLRDEFKEERVRVNRRQGLIKKILVSFGGVDASNCTTRVLQALIESNFQLAIDVVVGSQHPNLDQIMAICNLHDYVYHVDVGHMAKLMSNADLAIGAGGSSSWERCCLGLPTLAFSLAENQTEIAKNLDMYGACIYMGNANSKNLMDLKDMLSQLLSNPEQVSNLSKKAYSLVDGLGAERVHQELISYHQEML